MQDDGGLLYCPHKSGINRWTVSCPLPECPPLPEWPQSLTFPSVHGETCVLRKEANDEGGFVDAFEGLLPGRVSLSLVGASIFQLFFCAEYLASSTPMVSAHILFGNSFSVNSSSPTLGFSRLQCPLYLSRGPLGPLVTSHTLCLELWVCLLDLMG